MLLKNIAFAPLLAALFANVALAAPYRLDVRS